MNAVTLKTSLFLTLMIVFIVIAFITDDPVNGQLYASLGIITGSYANKFISTPQVITIKKYRNTFGFRFAGHTRINKKVIGSLLSPSYCDKTQNE
jgi:hypothetical protein